MLKFCLDYMEHEAVVLKDAAAFLEKHGPVVPPPVYHPIRGHVHGRRLEHVQPIGTYSKWDSDFIYGIYSMRNQDRPSNGYHLQQLFQAATFLQLPGLVRLITAQLAVHLADRGAAGIEASLAARNVFLHAKSITYHDAAATPATDAGTTPAADADAPPPPVGWVVTDVLDAAGQPVRRSLADTPDAYIDGQLKAAHEWAYDFQKPEPEEEEVLEDDMPMF